MMNGEFEISMMGQLPWNVNQANSHWNLDSLIKICKRSTQKIKMEEPKDIDIPFATTIKLDLDKMGSSRDQKMYRGIIGSLLYLTASRPDIVFSVGLCGRYQVNSKESHLKSFKSILRYFKGTIDLGLWYPEESNFNLWKCRF